MTFAYVYMVETLPHLMICIGAIIDILSASTGHATEVLVCWHARRVGLTFEGDREQLHI